MGMVLPDLVSVQVGVRTRGPKEMTSIVPADYDDSG